MPDGDITFDWFHIIKLAGEALDDVRKGEALVTVGFLGGISSLVQAAKRKAREYRTTAKLITMIYLIAGKPDFQLAHL